SEIDRIGYKHYRFQQYYKGILVKGGEYLVHEKQGYITSANGTVYSGITARATPLLAESAALTNILPKIPVKKFRWENADAEKALRERSKNPQASYYPKGTLVIAAENSNYSTSENFHLA